MSRNFEDKDKEPLDIDEEDYNDGNSSATEDNLGEDDDLESGNFLDEDIDEVQDEFLVDERSLLKTTLQKYVQLHQLLIKHVNHNELVQLSLMIEKYLNSISTENHLILSQIKEFLDGELNKLTFEKENKSLHEESFINLQQCLLKLDDLYWKSQLSKLLVTNTTNKDQDSQSKKDDKSTSLDQDYEEDILFHDDELSISPQLHYMDTSKKVVTSPPPSLQFKIQHEKLLSQKSELEINPLFLPSLKLIEQLLSKALLKDEYEEYFVKAKKLVEAVKITNSENIDDLLRIVHNLTTEILDRQIVLRQKSRTSVLIVDMDLPPSSDEDVMIINNEIMTAKKLSSVTVPPMTLLQLMSYENVDQLTSNLKKLTGHENQRYIIVPVYPHNFNNKISEKEFAQKIDNKVGHYATMVIDTKQNKTYYFDSMGIMNDQKELNIYHGMAQPLLEKFNISDLTPTIQIQESGTNSCAQWYKSASIKICQLITNESDNIKIDLNSWAYHNSHQVEKEYRKRFDKKEQKSGLRFREFVEDSDEIHIVEKSFKFPTNLFGGFNVQKLGKPKDMSDLTINPFDIISEKDDLLILERKKYEEKLALQKMLDEKQLSSGSKDVKKEKKSIQPPSLNITYPLGQVEEINNKLKKLHSDITTLPPISLISLNAFLKKIDEEENRLAKLAKMLNAENKRFIVIPIFPTFQNDFHKEQQDSQQKNFSTLIIDTQDKKNGVMAYYFDCCTKKESKPEPALQSFTTLLNNLVPVIPNNQQESDVSAINFNQSYLNCCNLIYLCLNENGVDLNLLKHKFNLALNVDLVIDELATDENLDVLDSKNINKRDELKKILLEHISKKYSKEVKLKPTDVLDVIFSKHLDALFMLKDANLLFVYDYIFRCCSKGFSVSQAVKSLKDTIDILQIHLKDKHAIDAEDNELFNILLYQNPDKLFMLGENSICFVYDQVLSLLKKKYTLNQALSILSDTIKAPYTPNISLDLTKNSQRLDEYSYNLLDPDRLQIYGDLIDIDLTYIDETRKSKKSTTETSDTGNKEDEQDLTDIPETDQANDNETIPVIVKRQFPLQFDFSDTLPWQVISDCFIDQGYEVAKTNLLYEGSEKDKDLLVYGFRPNHGPTHSIKQLVFLEKILDLLSRHGSSQYQHALENLTPSEMACMQLAMFVYRAGRTNEDSGKANPFNIYRSRKIYEFLARGFGFDKNLCEQIGEGINIYTGLNTFLYYEPELDKGFHQEPLYILCNKFNLLFNLINNLGPSDLEELKKYPEHAEHLNLLLKECCSKDPNFKKIDSLYKLITNKFDTIFQGKFANISDLLKDMSNDLIEENFKKINPKLVDIINLKINKSILMSSMLKICHGNDLVRCKKDQEGIVEEIEPYVMELFDNKKVNINNLIDQMLDMARQANIIVGGKVECPSTKYEMVNNYDAKRHYLCCRDVNGCLKKLSVQLEPIDENLIVKKDLSRYRKMEKGGRFSTYSENIGVISPYRNRKGEIIARGEYATELLQKDGKEIECIRINSALFYTSALIPVKHKPSTAYTVSGYRDIHQDHLTGEIMWASGKVYSSAAYVAAGRLRRAGLWVAKYRAEHAWEYNPQAYVKKLVDDVLESKKKIEEMKFTKESIHQSCENLRGKIRNAILKNQNEYNSSDLLSAYNKIEDLQEKLLQYLELFEKFKQNCKIMDNNEFKDFANERLIQFIKINEREYIPNPESIEEAQSNVALIDEAKKFFQFDGILNNFKNFEAVLKRMESIQETEFTSVAQGKKLIENFVNKDNRSRNQNIKKGKKKGEPETVLPTVIESLQKEFVYSDDIEVVQIKKDDMRYVLQNPRIVSFLVPVEDFENIVNVAVEEETKTHYDYIASVDKRFEPNQFSFENRLLMNLRNCIVPRTFESYHYNIYLRTPEQILQEGLSFSIDDMAESIGQAPSEFVLDDIWTSGTGFAALGGIDLNKRAIYLSDLYNTWQVVNNYKLAPQIFGNISQEGKELHLKKFMQFIFTFLPQDIDKKEVYTVIELLSKQQSIENTHPLYLIYKDIERLMKIVSHSADEARMQYTVMDNRMTLVDREGYTSDTDIGIKPFVQIFSKKDKKTKYLEMKMIKIGQDIAKELKTEKNMHELPDKILNILRTDPELKYRLLKPSSNQNRCMIDKHILKMISTVIDFELDLTNKQNKIILAGLLFHDMEKYESQLRAQSANRPTDQDNLTRDLMKRYFPLINTVTGGINNKEMEILLIAISNNPFNSKEALQNGFKDSLKKLLLTFNKDISRLNAEECLPLLQCALTVAAIQFNDKRMLQEINNEQLLLENISMMKEELIFDNVLQIKEWYGMISNLEKIPLDGISFYEESKQKTKEQSSKSEGMEKLSEEDVSDEKIKYCDKDDDIIGAIQDITKLKDQDLLDALNLISYNDFRNVYYPIVKLLKALDPLDGDKLSFFYKNGDLKKDLSHEDKKMMEKLRQGRGERLYQALQNYQCMIPKDQKNMLIDELASAVLRERAHFDFLIINDNLNEISREKLKKQPKRITLLTEIQENEITFPRHSVVPLKTSKDDTWEKICKESETLELQKLSKQKDKVKLKMSDHITKPEVTDTGKDLSQHKDTVSMPLDSSDSDEENSSTTGFLFDDDPELVEEFTIGNNLTLTVSENMNFTYIEIKATEQLKENETFLEEFQKKLEEKNITYEVAQENTYTIKLSGEFKSTELVNWMKDWFPPNIKSLNKSY